MGTWSLPQTTKQAKKLKQLLQKPLRADEAEDKIYHLLGDDDLFDSILEAKQKDGKDSDVRILIVRYLEDFIDNKENYVKPWSKESLKICQKICDKINKVIVLKAKYPGCLIQGFDH